MLRACNVDYRINNDNDAAPRAEIIHNYFAKYVHINFYILY